MPAPAKSFTVIADAAVDVDSPLDEALVTALRDNTFHLEEWIGKSYTAAVDHNHDGVNSAIISGAWTLLDNQTITGVASVSITSKITSAYDDYVWIGENILIANDNDTMTLQGSKDNNGSNESSNYWIGIANAALAAGAVAKTGLNNSSTLPMTFTMQFFNPLSIAVAKQWTWKLSTPITGTGVVNAFDYHCMWNETGATKFFNALKLSVTSTMSGNFKFYGINKA